MPREAPALTIGDVIERSAVYLRERSVETPRLDAELLLAHLLGCDRLRLYMDWQKPLTELEVAAYRESIRRRGQDRAPVARITGEKEFYGRAFAVTDAFVPRPETELLAERALGLLDADPFLSSLGQPVVFEVGVGTGCLLLTIAAEFPSARCLGSDVSAGALETARANARRHRLDQRVTFREGSHFAGYEGTIALVVSNPPYIRRDEIETLQPEVARHDPRPALDGGDDGLDMVRELLNRLPARLAQGGWLALELGEDQPPRVASLLETTRLYDHILVEKDMAGRDRFVVARRALS